MTAPSFTPPVKKVSFTLLYVDDSVIQSVIEVVTTIINMVYGQVIVEIEEVKDEPLPESIHLS